MGKKKEGISKMNGNIIFVMIEKYLLGRVSSSTFSSLHPLLFLFLFFLFPFLFLFFLFIFFVFMLSFPGDRGDSFKFKLGLGEVIKGWDVAVAQMTKGEKSLLTLRADYAYGDSGAGAKIPGGATLQFEVELLSFRPVPKAAWQLSPEEKIQAAADAKNRGNSLFLAKDFQGASQAYREGLDMFADVECDEEDSLRAEHDATKRSLHLNQANCCLKTGDHIAAVEQSTKALEINAKCSKGLYRRGVARTALGDLQAAAEDLKAAALLAPNAVDIRSALKECREKMQVEKEQQRETFNAMFKKVGGLYKEKKGVRQFAKLPRVFLSIQAGEAAPQRFVFALYQDVVPRTANNFKALCTGEKGKNKAGNLLHFKGNKFHRLISGFMMQGGDITKGDGTGGESIYGGQFADEGFEDVHEKRGMLSMANAGPDTNNSQFFITFAPATHLDKKHVVFGECVEGEEQLAALEALETGDNDVPKVDVTIVDCGLA
eukprot:GHVT01010528.1.p1 GENE.GHVT01010528.1~~GHVT01010528.1.p1  ORF type:complete len:488 (-),score=146.41 GHVT01010528.1:248-1711(-)